MKALVVVSFGSSVTKARETIEKVEKALIDNNTDRDFYRAYTSTIICKKLQGQGEDISGLTEVLASLIEIGYDDVLIQPTHVMAGHEYEKICRQVEAVRDKIPTLYVGEPLINDTEDLRKVADIITNSWLPDNRHLVLMGHGSSHSNNMIYPAIQTAFSIKHPRRVFVGTVEGWPEITDVMRVLRRAGDKKVTLAPFMLVAGDHAINDMAGDEEDSWKKQLEAAGYKVECILDGMGDIPEIQQMYVEKAAALLS